MLPKTAELSHRRAAGMARATAGRASAFDSRKVKVDARRDIQNRLSDIGPLPQNHTEEDPEPYADWDC